MKLKRKNSNNIMNTSYTKKKLVEKLVLFVFFFAVSLFVKAQSTVYFTNMVNPVSTGSYAATAVGTTGSFATNTLSWTGYDATTYPGYYLTSGSAGQVTVTFGTPVTLASCGSSNGNLIVKWGSTSNRPLNVSINGAANVQIDAVAVSADRSVVRTATYAIPSSITSISSIKLVSSGGGAVYIFSLDLQTCAAGPTLAVTGSPTAFTYVYGSGPSATQQISVSGQLLVAGSSVKVDAPTGFEVSLSSGSGYAPSVTIPNTAGGTLAATPVYVRLAAGLAVGPYSGNISISGGGASNSPTVAVTGTVTAPPSPTLSVTPLTLTGFNYQQGSGPSTTQTISVSGSALTAGQNVTVTVPSGYEVSLSSGSGFGPSVSITNTAGGTLSSTTVYVRLAAGLSQSVSVTGNITVSGGGAATSPTVALSGSVSAPPSAALGVSVTSLTGFSYIFGSGPSTNKTVDVTGTLLTAGVAVTVTATASYEVATSSTGPFSSSVSIPNTAGGTLVATTIYVRLKSGFSVSASYPGSLTVSGGGAASDATVSLSGAVLATPLPAPTVGTPSTATEDGFTANWSTVPNATGGYIVNVYQGTTLTKTVNVSGQTSTSTVINGLSSTTSYSYKVVAVGDGTNYSNSVESVASSTIMTLTATIVVDPACVITLYDSDFTDWDAVTASGTSSNAVSVNTRGGAGFVLTQDMTVNPTAGKLAIRIDSPTSHSERSLYLAPLNFLNGGSIIIYGKNTTSSSMGGIVGATAVTDVNTGTAVTIANVRSTDANGGVYALRFTLPAGAAANKVYEYKMRGEVYRIIVCTNAPATPYITTYPIPSKTLSTSAVVGGSSTVMNILVRGYNLTGDVSLSIVGADAGRFSLPVPSIAQASASTWKNVAIVYNPSVVVGVHNAQLKIESPGAATVYVNLVGLTTPTAGTTPVILANTNPLPFWTALIATTSNTINIAGINLTGNVTLAIEGSSQFTLSTTSIPKTDALAGSILTINYLGNITVTTDNATLVISSPGATTVRVPLIGYTLENRPVIKTINFLVSPSGSGVVSWAPAGNRFMVGTVLNVTATPEVNFKLDYWSDATGNKRLNRNIIVGDLSTITVFFVPGQQTPITDPTGALVAYLPTDITSTSFTASWSTVSDASSYTVNVYDANNTIVATFNTSSTTQSVTGLTPNTPYTYQVIANNTANDTSARVGPFNTLSVINPINCGE